jgi:hypothetical protein
MHALKIKIKNIYPIFDNIQGEKNQVCNGHMEKISV